MISDYFIKKADSFLDFISFRFWFDRKISEQYAVELSGFHKLRSFEDGIDFFSFGTILDYYHGDHKPEFNIMLVILNYKVFEFGIYNIHGTSWDDDELDQMKDMSEFEQIKEYNELMKSIGR